MTVPERNLAAALLLHRTTLVRYARVRLGSQEAAEDVVHDLWVRLEAREAAEADEPLPYLYRALANAVTDALRTRTRTARTISDIGVDDAVVEDAAIDEQPDGERIVVAQSRVAWIERVLADLPPSAAAALRRSRIDGESHRAIAVSMGISVSGVEKHLQRAYKALAAAQAAEAGDVTVAGARP